MILPAELNRAAGLILGSILDLKRGHLLAGLFLALIHAPAMGQVLKRASVWDLKLGQPLSAQPAADAFQALACGSNGNAPRQKLNDWSEFTKCPAEPSGLHEVYFEYDDENEYIARAHDMEREITRWTGTTETGFPVIISALIDDRSNVQGLRMVTDPRLAFRNDVFEAELRKREVAYQFGGVMAARYNLNPGEHCKSEPLAEGEGKIAGVYFKQLCEMRDKERNLIYTIKWNYYRKSGQNAYDPRVPGKATQGEFESSARFELRVDQQR